MGRTGQIWRSSVDHTSHQYQLPGFDAVLQLCKILPMGKLGLSGHMKAPYTSFFLKISNKSVIISQSKVLFKKMGRNVLSGCRNNTDGKEVLSLGSCIWVTRRSADCPEQGEEDTCLEGSPRYCSYFHFLNEYLKEFLPVYQPRWGILPFPPKVIILLLLFNESNWYVNQ